MIVSVERRAVSDQDIPLLRLLSMALATGLDALHVELAAAGHPTLRPAHGYVLNAISSGTDSASSIAPRLGMTKQGAAKLLQTLEADGYVEQSSAIEDGRRRPFVLTARGQSAVRSSVAVQKDIEDRWAVTLGTARMVELRAALLHAVLSQNDGLLPPVRPPW